MTGFRVGMKRRVFALLLAVFLCVHAPTVSYAEPVTITVTAVTIFKAVLLALGIGVAAYTLPELTSLMEQWLTSAGAAIRERWDTIVASATLVGSVFTLKLSDFAWEYIKPIFDSIWEFFGQGKYTQVSIHPPGTYTLAEALEVAPPINRKESFSYKLYLNNGEVIEQHYVYDVASETAVVYEYCEGVLRQTKDATKALAYGLKWHYQEFGDNSVCLYISFAGRSGSCFTAYWFGGDRAHAHTLEYNGYTFSISETVTVPIEINHAMPEDITYDELVESYSQAIDLGNEVVISIPADTISKDVAWGDVYVGDNAIVTGVDIGAQAGAGTGEGTQAKTLADILAAVKALPQSIGAEVSVAMTGELTATEEGWSLAGGGFQNKFPFSIPWDIAASVKILEKEAIEPKWEIPFKVQNSYINVNEKLVIDLTGEEWQMPIKVIRGFLLLLFIVGLAFATRALIRG